MLTNPNTLGLFDERIEEIAEMKTRSKKSKQIASSHSEKWSKKTKEVGSSHEVEFGKLAVTAAGEARILDQPPLIYHFSAKVISRGRAICCRGPCGRLPKIFAPPKNWLPFCTL